MRARVLGLAVGATLALAGPSVASGVVFESTLVQLTVQPGAVDEPLEWRFSNRGDLPLVVERFEQSCGCLSGAVDPAAIGEVAPGGSGAIQAKFTPGPYRGVIRKSLHVRFVGHEKPIELVAEVTIPSSVEVSDRDLGWPEGNLEPKTIEDTSGTDSDCHITGLTGVSESRNRVGRETIVEGRHYRITVTPANPEETTRTLLIRTDSADPRDRIKAVFLKTTPAAETPRSRKTGPSSTR